MTSIGDECRLYAEYFREAIYDRETKRGRMLTKKNQKRRDENTNERRRMTEEKGKIARRRYCSQRI